MKQSAVCINITNKNICMHMYIVICIMQIFYDHIHVFLAITMLHVVSTATHSFSLQFIDYNQIDYKINTPSSSPPLGGIKASASKHHHTPRNNNHNHAMT